MELAIDNIDRIISLKQLFEIKKSKRIKQNLIIGQLLYKTDEIYNCISDERIVFKDNLISENMFSEDVKTIFAGEDFVRIYNANNRLKNKPRFSVMYALGKDGEYKEYLRFNKESGKANHFWDKENLLIMSMFHDFRYQYLGKVKIDEYKSFVIPQYISYELDRLNKELKDCHNGINDHDFELEEERYDIIEDIKEDKENLLNEMRDLKEVKKLSKEVHDYYSKYNFLISAKEK